MYPGWSLWLLAVLLASGLADDEDASKDLSSSGGASSEDTEEQEASKTGAIFSNEETVSESHSSVIQTKDSSQNYIHKFETKIIPDASLAFLPHLGSNLATMQNIGSVKANSQFSSNYENLLMSDALAKESNSYPLGILGEEPFARQIPPNEYILLHSISGAENIITCTREGDLHNFWSPAYQCMVCACVRMQGYLKPVCVNCGGCMAPGKTPRFPADNPTTNIPGVTAVPEVEEIVTCSPLPMGKPFQNPLHPCQVCMCSQTINILGKQDVHIDCQQNPQCVLPENVPNLPVIPDSNSPVPLPLCEKFPHNVQFPHPSEACKVCKCIDHISPLGRKEERITCRPDPSCPSPRVPELTGPPPRFVPGIIPEPTTIPPYPTTTYDIVPVTQPTFTFPDIVTEAPWTPGAITERPLGPLPGPSPHESCKPYTPNQQFQHPWDECQTCVCTEAYQLNKVTIEVNCFTKKSCCIESPLEITQTGPLATTSLPIPQQGKVQIVDQICEFKSFGVEFTHPTDPCRTCVCELTGYLITSTCQPSLEPECLNAATFPNLAQTDSPLTQNNLNAISLNQNQLYQNQLYQNKLYQNQIYQNAVKNVGPYVATTQEPWNQGLNHQQGSLGLSYELNRLKGMPGYPGIKGGSGIQGPQGIQGIRGTPGLQGLQGIRGPQGIPNLQMKPGIPGIPGYPNYGNLKLGNGYKGRPNNWYNPAVGRPALSPELLQGYRGPGQGGYGYKVPYTYPKLGLTGMAGDIDNLSQTEATASATVKTFNTRMQMKSGNPDDAPPSDEED